MAKITIEIDKSLEEQLKERAKFLDISFNSYISKIIKDSIQNDWKADIKNLAGSWSDFPTLDEIRTTSYQDIQREEL